MGRSAGRLATLALSLVVMVLLSGCGGQKAKGPVSGKVTVDDKLVRSGQVTFVGGPDGKSHVIRLGIEGKYTIELPPGDYKVGVEGGVAPPSMGHVTVPKGTTGTMAAESAALAKEMQHPVIVPKHYRNPETSGLTVKATGGGDTFNIAMTKGKG